MSSRKSRLFKSLLKYSLIILLFLGLASWDETRLEPFNRTEWTAGDSRQQRRMARWMISDDVLTGLESSVVLTMLGEPDSRDESLIKFDLGRPLLEETTFFVIKLHQDKVVDCCLSVAGD